jgi:alkanesulfonate monooxygenase SsuD/methylene tetrahydromethanopterin reductase-like flavin-dependent oxidoreductase (luciferase family)
MTDCNSQSVQWQLVCSYKISKVFWLICYKVTKNLAFAITASTTFEPPFLLAKRFSTLDHPTGGRIGWNIVTSWKKSTFKAIGLDNPIEHDERYKQADEYLRVLYKLWEGSWSPNAIIKDVENDAYADPKLICTIHHHGKYYNLDTQHIVIMYA